VQKLKYPLKKKHLLKKLRLWVKKKLGWLGKPVIIPYSGYGNQEEIFFIGCVSEDKGVEKPVPQNTKWQNFIATVRRFASEDLQGINVKAEILGIWQSSVTDKLGIFRFNISIKERNMVLPKDPWIDINLKIMDDHDPAKKAEATGKVMLIKPGDSTYGVISDIDDTILVSHSTNVIRKLRLMFFKNAYTRLPFEGVAGFYRALNKGYHGDSFNPIFYVSNSQWNLYDLLTEFTNYRNIPGGVMLLQELKPFRPRKLIKRRRAIAKHPHKLDKIRSILSTYKHLRFVLIGDSGQKDAEIYQQVVKEFPGRILAIYIREVKKSREKEVLHIGTALKKEGVEMLLIKDTVYAAMHAIENGLISPESMEDVLNEKELDKRSFLKV
jgi:phosphatidate phosphatase APP1